MMLSLLDRLKIWFLIQLRYINRAAVETWSASTFRRRFRRTTSTLSLHSASEHYHAPLLNDALYVPTTLPAEGRIGFWYMLMYYYLAAIAFKAHRLWPIRPAPQWSPRAVFNHAFPRNHEGWADADTDAGFARLRLQGPNPFLLKNAGQEGVYQVDYTPFFEDIFDPCVCTFRLVSGRLTPQSIRVGSATSRPGDGEWERAKLIANGLDARYCVFTRHLLNAHLFIGEAFAIAAYSLPTSHSLRSFMEFFTYSTLVVNDYAYKLLLTPSSYFLQSNFISAGDALKLFDNSRRVFTLDDLIVPLDIEARGIDRIPRHPYVEDAREIWPVFRDFVSAFIARFYPTDLAVIEDHHLQTWYGDLARLLPNHDVTDAPLDSRDQLVLVLTCLLYNNVSHEVCGDYSPYIASQNPEYRRIVNFERLKARDFATPPTAADVFLFAQGAFASSFNNGGNNLMAMQVDEHIEDQHLRNAVVGFQATLKQLDERLAVRNEQREVPFLRMMPRQWEASICF